ncbi:sulfatase [Pirellulaceae bacterium]|nr:sulfatase [Pirellulaceae bacterium]
MLFPAILRACLVLVVVAIFSAFDFYFSVADDRPNIVFLMADDQCANSMGCYGTPKAQTPNLDRLASEGMVFDNHYVTTAICMASRANVMTGMFEYKTGCNFMHGALLQEHWRKSYPVLLKKAGYKIGFAGKFGFEVAKSPNQKGRLPVTDFDAWGGGPGQTSYQTRKNDAMTKYASQYPHSTLAYGAFGADFIAENADSPFCLSISFKAPHRPVSPDPRFEKVYQDVTFAKPKNFGRAYGKHFSMQSRQGRQFERFHSWEYSTNYNSVIAKYFQQIYAIDVAVGMIRKAIEENGVAKKTIVIYTSDNGFLNGAHGYGSKVLPYEESTRVPLIVLDPRSKTSGERLRCDSLTGNVDFAPTILSLAGLEIPQNIDGKSLLPLFENPETSIHHALPLINVWGPKETFSLSVVTKEWKYINWPFVNEKMKRSEELYDTERDPFELSNLVNVQEVSENLTSMQKLYDKTVEHWRAESVSYHGYQELAKFFKRQ